MESTEVKGYRILIIGDKQSGKTCLISRIFERAFVGDSPQKVSNAYQLKKINGNYFETIEFGDIYNYKEYREVFKKTIDGILIVFDLTNIDSINIIKQLLEKIYSYKKENQDIKHSVKICVGTKADLKEDIKLSKSDIIKFSTSNKKAIFKVSSKYNLGIDFLRSKFIQLLNQIRNPQIFKVDSFNKLKINQGEGSFTTNNFNQNMQTFNSTIKGYNDTLSKKHLTKSLMMSPQKESKSLNKKVEEKNIDSNENQENSTYLSIYEITVCYKKGNLSNTFFPEGNQSLGYLEIFSKEYFNIPNDFPICFKNKKGEILNLNMKISEIGNKETIYLIDSNEAKSFHTPLNKTTLKKNIEEDKDAKKDLTKINPKYNLNPQSKNIVPSKKSPTSTSNYFLPNFSQNIDLGSKKEENHQNDKLNQKVKYLPPLTNLKETTNKLGDFQREDSKNSKKELIKNNSEEIYEEFIKNTISKKTVLTTQTDQIKLKKKKDKLNREILLKETLLLEDYACTICLELLQDPYIATDGFSYHLKCIQTWLDKHDTSPTISSKLESKIITKNFQLNKIIEEKENEINSMKKKFEELSLVC